MKKHTIITKNDQGTLQESYIISKLSARDIKKESDNGKIKGLIAITDSKRVSHPSPAILVDVLQQLGVDVNDFYSMTEQKKAEIEGEDDQ